MTWPTRARGVESISLHIVVLCRKSVNEGRGGGMSDGNVLLTTCADIIHRWDVCLYE